VLTTAATTSTEPTDVQWPLHERPHFTAWPEQVDAAAVRADKPTMTVHTTASTPSSVSKRPLETGNGDCCEALIVCCALALEIRPLSTVLSRDHADSLITRARRQRTDEQVLRWRQFTFETTWQIHWAAARRVLRQFYPELPGVEDIAADHWDAGLPEISTACVT